MSLSDLQRKGFWIKQKGKGAFSGDVVKGGMAVMQYIWDTNILNYS
jgi:hypothetical protein